MILAKADEGDNPNTYVAQVKSISQKTDVLAINDTFSDVIQLFAKCKYRNCSHSKELGCAVNQAIEEGDTF